jgi:hypothetical protein
MVAFAKVKPGDTLYDVHRYKPNGGGSKLGCWSVYVEEVREGGVMARWNGNPARWFGERAVAKWRRSPPKKRD